MIVLNMQSVMPSLSQKLGFFRFLIVLLFFVNIVNSGIAQVQCKIIRGEKVHYRSGDELSIQFQLIVDPKSCQDGMEKTGIYSSGMKILDKSDWLELKKGLWQITLNCKLIGTKKGFGQLTIVRKTDKQNLFKQLKFEVQKDGSSEGEK